LGILYGKKVGVAHEKKGQEHNSQVKKKSGNPGTIVGSSLVPEAL